MSKQMETLIRNMKEKTCQKQLKAIAYKVSLAMAAGEKKVVVSPICAENLKAVIVTYEATITRATEENGLILDIISWEEDLPREAISDENYITNFHKKDVSFEEFKQLIQNKKGYEMKICDVERNKV